MPPLNELTFSYTVDLKDIGDDTLNLSPPTQGDQFPWKIVVRKNERALSFFVQCNGEDNSTAWSCQASGKLTLQCHKPGAQNMTRQRFAHLFKSTANDYGFEYFIPLLELENPEKGYMKNGKITLMAHVLIGQQTV